MRRDILLTAVLCAAAGAAEPVRTAWILSPAAAKVPRPLWPEVHEVRIDGGYATVKSAGVSLKYLGPLQPPPVPSEAVREFEFRIPLHPEPASGRGARVPVDVIGTFVNGLPIYNQFEALSYNGANLWHYDAVAARDDGTLTAAGQTRADLTHTSAAGLLEELIQDGRRHSPLIGFALDGYPVYGPWAFADGGLRRMRSSYRLRRTTRHDWPDGTRLTPAQYGPDVSATNPLGTFAEDYEYVAGAGDLDESNGRFAVTPEYPQGTYAYFLTTDGRGRLVYPYLIGPRFHGRVAARTENRFLPIGKQRLTLLSSERQITAGEAVRFRLEAATAKGEPIRHFEYVHERPIHFLIVSADLAHFDHIHPELTPDDAYEVSHTFAEGGRYRIWTDYSLPGEAPRVETFDVDVRGGGAAPARAIRGEISVALRPDKAVRAGEDIPITLALTGNRDGLEPYLGAWAHVIVVSEDLRTFIHAHPQEAAGLSHTHTPGPAPETIHLLTSFPAAGRYKLWAQIQERGKVRTFPFEIQVAPAVGRSESPRIPEQALQIHITKRGFEPASVEIPANKAIEVVFIREAEPNCGSEVVFPDPGIRRAIPLGGSVVVHLPAQSPREITFSCGMGMYKGMIVAR